MNAELEAWIEEMIDELEPVDLNPNEIFSDNLLEELYNSLKENK